MTKLNLHSFLILPMFVALLTAGCYPDEDDDDATDPEWVDEDGDGFGVRDDCDDAHADIWPGAPDPCDDVDQDCDGADGTDADGDGFSTCAQDCDDDDEDVYPLAEEVSNGIDDDCDGEIDEFTLPCSSPEFEPNDAAAVANEVDADGEVCGLIDPPGDEDWFAFTVDDFTLVEFDVDAVDDGSELSPKIDVWSMDGVSERCGTVGTADMTIQSFFGQAGTYYVTMASMMASASGLEHYYTLVMSSSNPCVHTEVEGNGGHSWANLLPADETMCGFVEGDSDKDWFAFQAQSGETWTIDMDSFEVGSTLKGQLTLYGADGETELAMDDPTYPDDPILTWTTDYTGWHYIQVESDFYGTYDNGGYLLNLYQ
jgi:hypothetical protein